MLDKKRIMITGANGTLGSIISKKLYENNADLVTAKMQSIVEEAAAEIVSGAITVADWSQE